MSDASGEGPQRMVVVTPDRRGGWREVRGEGASLRVTAELGAGSLILIALAVAGGILLAGFIGYLLVGSRLGG